VPLVNWLAVPIGLTIFNVILLNEFPDYPADLVTGKANMVMRLGPERASRLYGLTSLGRTVHAKYCAPWPNMWWSEGAEKR
jgi:1,4-dihydroxy-2-naphthoate octaprenyltransferase